MKYFLYNKALDYGKGYMDNCLYDGSVLRVAEPEQNPLGIFISPVMDSRESETVWHRFSMSCESIGEASIQFSMYSSDRKEGVEGLLKDLRISLTEKKQALKTYLKAEFLNPEDVLLHQVRGRYFWFLAQLYAQGTVSPGIRTMQIFFPKETWTSYLPELYRSDPESASFLDRFLGIFQSIYEETEQKIRSADRLLDPRITEPQVLSWLAGWLDVDHVSMWPKDQLRSLMGQAVGLYKIRGTREGLLSMVRLYIGREQDVFLVEHHDLSPFLSDLERGTCWERLYGSDKNPCFLLIKEEAVRSPFEFRALQCIVEEERPAQTPVKLVVLKPYITLGSHSYMGVNTYLWRPRPLQLDGVSLLPYTVLGTQESNMEESV